MNEDPATTVPALERISQAAIRRDSDGHVFTLPPPARHTHIIDHIIEASSGTVKRVGYGYRQGFITTNAARFVDRKEACTIARAAGQIEGKLWISNLYSEDVW